MVSDIIRAMIFIDISCIHWLDRVVNLFLHVTAVNQFDYKIDQVNCRIAVTCKNKFTTPPHQEIRVFYEYYRSHQVGLN